MKANELRIWNYLHLINDSLESFNIEIRAICRDDDGYYIQFTYLDDQGDKPIHEQPLEEWIQPIPLTEEWLKKFGFEYDTVIWHKDRIMLASANREFSTWYGSFIYGKIDIFVKTVHQLQNLYFALTGEELVLAE
jgi:hypothetical protein